MEPKFCLVEKPPCLITFSNDIYHLSTHYPLIIIISRSINSLVPKKLGRGVLQGNMMEIIPHKYFNTMGLPTDVMADGAMFRIMGGIENR